MGRDVPLADTHRAVKKLVEKDTQGVDKQHLVCYTYIIKREEIKSDEEDQGCEVRKVVVRTGVRS